MSVSYTYDANGNTLTERTNGTVSATYAYDAVNKLISYTAGNVGYTYTYDAFGVELSPVSSDANPFRYAGEYFDAETGDY